LDVDWTDPYPWRVARKATGRDTDRAQLGDADTESCSQYGVLGPSKQHDCRKGLGVQMRSGEEGGRGREERGGEERRREERAVW
jgi:hypothetical protein